jgi:CelD/BcsL family acetyltransferase involved in cellulose biosynthesis
VEIRRWTRDEWRAAAGDWSRLLQQSDADPLFLSFAWLSTWWQLYGGHGRELCMLAGYDTGRLIGIAPFYIERVGGPAFGHKSACVIGGARRIGGPRGMLTEYLDVIALREHADDFRVRALQFLDSQLQVKEYRINLSASWTSWQLAFERLSGGLHYLRRSSVALSYQADLGRGFNHYLSTLSSSSRRALWNRRALLASNGLVAVETAPAADALVTLQQLNELHRQRWGMPAFDEIGLRFHVQLVAALSGSAKVHLSKLSVGGQLVSVLYDLSVGATRYNIQMGFDEKFDPRLSLGKLHLGYAMEEAAKCGATRYDFLVGRGRATDYKVRIAQQSREICDLRATSRGTLGRLFIVADRVRGHAWPTERLYGAGFGRRATDSGSQTGLWREYLRSPGSAAPLRVGVMLDSLSLMRPFVATLRHIAQSDFAELSAVILNGGTAATSPQASKPLIARLFGVLADKKRRSGLLYAFYERRDRLSHPKQQALLDSEDVAPLLSGAVKLTMTPVRTGYVDRFSPADVESMRRLKLDVVLRYGFGIIRGEVLDIATCGIWSYHHDDNEFYRGAPPGFWELYENAELTGATLQVLNDSLDGGYVLARVRAPTAQGLSMVRNRVVP